MVDISIVNSQLGPTNTTVGHHVVRILGFFGDRTEVEGLKMGQCHIKYDNQPLDLYTPISLLSLLGNFFKARNRPTSSALRQPCFWGPPEFYPVHENSPSKAKASPSSKSLYSSVLLQCLRDRHVKHDACVYEHICISYYTHIVYTYNYIYTYVHINMHVSMHICILYIYKHTYISTCLYVYKYATCRIRSPANPRTF